CPSTTLFRSPAAGAGTGGRRSGGAHPGYRVPAMSPTAPVSADMHALLKEAAQRLEAGSLVAFPTETVYGLGADAENPQAIARIYSAKGRPSNHPVIVHVAP